MSKWHVRLSDTAAEELNDIYCYVAIGLQAPETAARLFKRITTAIFSLDEMPLRFPRYDKEPWESLDLRKFSVDNFVIFYFTSESTKEVVVAHIFYGGRDTDEIIENDQYKNGD